MLRIPSWIKRNPVWSIAFLSVVAIVGLNQAKERSLWIQESAAKGSDQIVGKIDRTVDDSFTQSTPNSASLAQSMRQEFNSKEQCFEEIKPNVFGGKFKYCVKGGKVLSESGKLEGYIGKKFSNDGKIKEWLIENGKLVRYRCYVSGYKYDCGDIDREVFVKTKSRQEVLESKEKFNNYFDSGNAKNKSKDYQGAIADYSKAISIDPQDALVYHDRGRIKHILKDYQGAIADYSKAISIDPQGALVYYNRGKIKHILKDYQGAIADFNKAIAIDKQFAQFAPIYTNRGRVKYDLRDQQGACADYKKAVSLGDQGTAQWLNSEKGEWCRNMQ